MTHTQILACIDASPFATSVCDHTAWAAGRLAAPVTLLHAIDHRRAAGPADFTGAIGLGSQEALLDALAAHDHEAGKLALERSRHLLDAARLRVAATHQETPEAPVKQVQVHGHLVDELVALEPDIRLVVLGRRGEGAGGAEEHLGSHLERIVRALHRPILVVPQTFTPPTQVMLAFDDGASAQNAIRILMRGPLFAGLTCHVVTAGDPAGPMAPRHAWAMEQLASAGLDVRGHLVAGDAETVLADYQRDHAIDLVVMGAYGHSRIRHLLVGSTTTAMIRRTPVAVLLLR